MSRRPFGALAVTALVALAATGCSTYAAARYSVSPETVSALRAYRPMTVAVGPFTAARPGETEITCRAVGPSSDSISHPASTSPTPPGTSRSW